MSALLLVCHINCPSARESSGVRCSGRRHRLHRRRCHSSAPGLSRQCSAESKYRARGGTASGIFLPLSSLCQNKCSSNPLATMKSMGNYSSPNPPSPAKTSRAHLSPRRVHAADAARLALHVLLLEFVSMNQNWLALGLAKRAARSRCRWIIQRRTT